MTSQNSLSNFRDTASDEGFFKECFKNFKNVTTENQLKDFELIKTDEERVRFVQKLFPDNFKFPIEISESKNFESAKDLKKKGNQVFVKNDNRAALEFYSKAILATPYTEENLGELAITLANRSAALYHIQDYESALNDINWALDLPYPKELKYKIHERKARCLLALNQHKEALLEFRNTLQALDDSKLPTEKKLKMQTDIQIMLGVMTKPKTKSGHVNAFLESSKNKNTIKEEPKHKLCSSRNKIYEAGCDKFEILESNELGRYASATDDIKAGDTILIEKAFCTAMLRECSLTHCTHCFKRTYAPYPCKTCSNVIFCSAECRDKAEDSYHKFECKILNTIYKSGASVMVLMALRMVTERSPNFFLEIKNKLQDKPEFKKYKTSDYLTAYNLVTHENQRTAKDFFERTTMALFLLQCLKKSNYFQNSTQDNTKISDEEFFIASLILRHLQLLQFNAHEIFELEVAPNRRIDDSQTIFIGGALFPTLALFNHSCDPDTIRYFDGTTVIMRTMKPVRKGEMISENYGPLFTLTNKNERQDVLKSQFWFDCTCTACEENWPTFHEMNKKLLRFRCDARREDGGKYNNCDNVVAVPVDTEEFLAPCLLCGQRTNIFKGLKALQDTDAMFKQASRDMEKGNYKAALAIYIEIITILDGVMKPPFQDFTLCQQAIRKCMLTFGNKYVKNS